MHRQQLDITYDTFHLLTVSLKIFCQHECMCVFVEMSNHVNILALDQYIRGTW